MPAVETVDGPPRARPTYRDLLTQRRSGRFFLGQAVSGFGDSLVPVALSFAVLRLTGSIAALAAALALTRTAALVVQLAGGVFGDRVNSRRLVVVTALAAFLLNMASAVGLVAPLPQTAGAALLIGTQVLAATASSFGAPAGGKLLRSVFTDPRAVAAAVGLGRTTKSVVQVAAQAASGLVVLLSSPAWCFVLNALSFLVFVLCLPSTAPDGSAPAPGRPRRIGAVLADLADGWRATTADKAFLGSLLAYAASWLLIAQPFLTATPLILQTALGERSSLVWGLVGACFGLGGIAAGILAQRVTPMRPLTLSVLVSLADIPLMVQLAVAPGVPLLYLWAFVSGLQSVVSRIWLMQQLYDRFAPSLTARVLSWVNVSWMLPAIIGSAMMPGLLAALGADRSLWVLIAVFAVAVLVLGAGVARHEPRGDRHVG